MKGQKPMQITESPDGAAGTVYHLTMGGGETVEVVLASQAKAQAAQLRAQLDGAVQELAQQAARASTAMLYLLATVRNIGGLVLTTVENEDVKNAVVYAEMEASDAMKQIPTTAHTFVRVNQVAPALSAKTRDGMDHLLHVEKSTKFETPQWDKAVGKTVPLATGDTLNVEQINQVVAELMGGWKAGNLHEAASQKAAKGALQAAWDKSVQSKQGGFGGVQLDGPPVFDGLGHPAWLKEVVHAGAQPLPKWYPKVVDGELVLDDDAGAAEEAQDALTKFGFPHGNAFQPFAGKVAELWAKKIVGLDAPWIKMTHSEGEAPEGAGTYIKFDPELKSIALSVSGWLDFPASKNVGPLFLAAPCASEAVAQQVAEEFETVFHAYLGGEVGDGFVQDWFTGALKKAHNAAGFIVKD